MRKIKHKKLKYKYSIITFLICLPLLVTGQKSEKSLYLELEHNYKNAKTNSLKEEYAKKYLTNAKTKNNKIQIAKGYKLLADLCYGEVKLKYADSIILISKDLDHKKYPAKGFIIKGNVLYELGKSKEALNQYLNALQFAKKNKNQFQEFVINFNIGLLKNILGDRDEAQKIFKYSIDLIEKNKENKEYFSVYHRVLYALADSYVYSYKYKLANETTKKGINLSLRFKDDETYSYFVLNSGINHFFDKQYLIACDSLKKSKEILHRLDNQETRIALCNYYIGRSLINLNKNKQATQYFKDVDSIIQQTNDVTPELINVYSYLIEDAQKNNDLTSELSYTKSLIKFDSILDTNYKYLKKNITKKYDTPKLIQDRDSLISLLNSNKKQLNTRLILLTIIALIFLAVLIYFIKRNFNNKHRYNQLIKEVKSRAVKNDEDTVELAKVPTLGIPEHLIEKILVKLEKFESTNQFLHKKYTLNSLAKELNTNSTYLSKVINVTKNTNFAHYLNNLRIDFAIDKLSKDPKFRSFTIKAIAQDSGFNTAQSFTNAFHKKTGIYPSYFIKQLELKNK